MAKYAFLRDGNYSLFVTLYLMKTCKNAFIFSHTDISLSLNIKILHVNHVLLFFLCSCHYNLTVQYKHRHSFDVVFVIPRSHVYGDSRIMAILRL